MVSYFGRLASCTKGSEKEKYLKMQFSLAAYAAGISNTLSEVLPKMLRKMFMTEVRVKIGV